MIHFMCAVGQQQSFPSPTSPLARGATTGEEAAASADFRKASLMHLRAESLHCVLADRFA